MPLNKLIPAALSLTLAALTGCGIGTSNSTNKTTTTALAHHVSGSVHGGQQPIVGSTIQLYAVGSGSYGAASTALVTATVLSDANGNWDITGLYTCPSNSAQVYLTATGGYPVVGQTQNTNLALMAALGSCGNLAAATFVTINEITTVGSVYALSAFMTGPTAVGAPASNALGLTNAFATVTKIVNVTTGTNGGAALPTGATVPASELNTLANIIASCVNSTGGVATNTATSCGALFAAATPPSGTAPTDTITAALDIAKYPGQNVSTLYAISSPTGPFQPTLAAAPTDFTVGIRYAQAGAFSSPSGIAADQSGNVWVANATSHSITFLPVTGAASTYAAGLSGNGAIAIDLAGNAWAADATSGSILKVTSAGTTTTYTGGGLATTNAIAIDGSGQVWAAESTNVLSAFSSAGSPVATSGYTGAGLATPESLSITPR